MAKKGKKASRVTKAPKGAGASDANEPADLKNIPFCTEISLPPELAGEALTAAVNERADNVLLPGMASGLGMASVSMSTAMLDMPAIAVVAKKLWKPGRTLRVRFLDKPDPVIREKIEEFAREWEKYINVRFAFGSSAKAEIRITCTLGIGSWSYLGTDALLIPAGEPTMNYGWFTEETPDQEFSRTVLHEFGHALGAIHEHQHPEAGIPWNKEAVYRYYKQTQGWSKGDVDAQIFNKYDKTSLNTSVYDRKSIMHYPVPKELTLGGFQIGWNRVLSSKDKTFMRHIYPSK